MYFNLTYAIVIKLLVFSKLFIIVTNYDFDIDQIDIKIVFLYRFID